MYLDWPKSNLWLGSMSHLKIGGDTLITGNLTLLTELIGRASHVPK